MPHFFFLSLMMRWCNEVCVQNTFKEINNNNKNNEKKVVQPVQSVVKCGKREVIIL